MFIVGLRLVTKTSFCCVACVLLRVRLQLCRAPYFRRCSGPLQLQHDRRLVWWYCLRTLIHFVYLSNIVFIILYRNSLTNQTTSVLVTSLRTAAHTPPAPTSQTTSPRSPSLHPSTSFSSCERTIRGPNQTGTSRGVQNQSLLKSRARWHPTSSRPSRQRQRSPFRATRYRPRWWRKTKSSSNSSRH